MNPVRTHEWDLTPKQAIDLQKSLASDIVLKDRFKGPEFVAGIDVGFEQKEKSHGRQLWCWSMFHWN